MERRMNLHDDEEAFRELINRTAQHFNIPEVYVEKDYWVTRVLLLLSRSEFKGDFIFKGGTALSKVHGLIKRFSEDVDLAFYNEKGLSGNQIKNRMKSAQDRITAGLKYVQRPGESKGGAFRKVYFEFPRILDGLFGQASDVILLETNSFTSPEPFSLMPVETLIAEFLWNANAENVDIEKLIKQYQLETFEVNVLDIRRTVAEKLLSLVKASRSDDPASALADKIRHIYDLCLIRRDKQHRGIFSSEELQALIGIVINADREQFKDSAFWLNEPLHECTIFSHSESIWEQLRPVFHGEFAELVYDDDLPSDGEVLELLSVLKETLINRT